MKNPETPIVRDIQAELSRGDVRLWRNNRGKAWQGKISHLQNGSILIEHPRCIDFGLCDGAGDLIGYRSMVVTPDMVGVRVALIVTGEVKSEHGRMRAAQDAFRFLIDGAGGISFVARNVDEARRGIMLR